MKNFFNNFKRVLVETKEGIKGRICWILFYKKINKEWSEETLENDLLKVQFENTKIKLETENINIAKEKDNLLKLRDIRVEQLNETISNQRREIKHLSTIITDNNILIEDLDKTIEDKELSRRINAGKIGGLVKYNNQLKNELEIANKKIEFLKANRRAPSKEEIVAYEYNQREVLKRTNDNSRED